jgi:hypothetical protein
MKNRLAFMLTIMFLSWGMPVHAQALTADDLIEKIKSIVDIDFEQEDKLKPVLGDYVDSINQINGLAQKNVDRLVINEKLSKANNVLDAQLKNVLTDNQMRQWNAEKRVMYKEISNLPDAPRP